MAHFKSKQLGRYVDQFKSKSILVVGDLILDSYIWGKVNRISPEAPVPVLNIQKEEFVLGGAANLAHNLSTLGAQVTLCGYVGKDNNAKVLLKNIKNSKINPQGIIITSEKPTIKKTRLIADRQQIVRIDEEDASSLSKNDFQKIKLFLGKTWNEYDAVIISDYAKGTIDENLLNQIHDLKRKKDKFISVDPKERNFHLYKNISLLTPNEKEASYFSGIHIENEITLIKAGEKILDLTQCENLVITLGAQGMAWFDQKKGYFKLPTFTREVFDVSGAGDTAIAVLTLSFCAHIPTKTSLTLANAAAGIVVQKMGTAAIHSEELKNYIHSFKPKVDLSL
ncbi:MAG: D-glycero-beta-D-manno-heptose-7-phosphate kinase [Deltaproteobacteria bacterium]|nr:D-glycero-beta-D-manno-heptose-7-phosphate kinase [Deltaproteobacteria bacterium]